ncbi:MAG: 23S rRNA (uracil(1939)-C(5))-methyltransferase RlmD, partial [Bacteroidia bacterium]|nr:23S rRNA (uracil(1939)-C(5))-methyltransferase RlmD [Bacteroidia bacterium]
DIQQQTGILRNLILRNSPVTGERMVILILAENNRSVVEQIFVPLAAEFPEISSFIFIVNPKKNDSYSDLPFEVWKGKPHLTERLGNFEYLISPVSFFQTNTKQAEKLYQVVKNRMNQHEIVYDLYCGAGSIGIFVSDKAKQIYGIEFVEKAVEDANLNCQQNQLHHLQFLAGDIATKLSDNFIQKTGKPDLIITDPPRAGMDSKVCKQLIAIEAPKIIYVSCNPATQARDLQILSEKYKITFVQPVDLFPQTAHVETVVELELK